HDLHSGNVMVSLTTADEPVLHLLDLHDVRIRRPLSWRASRDNLAVFTRWFRLHVGRADRLRCWHAYFRARFESCDWPAPAGIDRSNLYGALASELETRAHDSVLSFWRRRDGRSLRTNRYYRRVRAPGVV